MYGTVSRLKAKPGMEEQLKSWEMDPVPPGFVAAYAYQMDTDPEEFYIAVIFESREAYVANAESLEQNARFLEMMQLLDAEPEWHDGEIFLTEA